jgi:hypothetical protein
MESLDRSVESLDGWMFAEFLMDLWKSLWIAYRVPGFKTHKANACLSGNEFTVLGSP